MESDPDGIIREAWVTQPGWLHPTFDPHLPSNAFREASVRGQDIRRGQAPLDCEVMGHDAVVDGSFDCGILRDLIEDRLATVSGLRPVAESDQASQPLSGDAGLPVIRQDGLVRMDLGYLQSGDNLMDSTTGLSPTHTSEEAPETPLGRMDGSDEAENPNVIDPALLAISPRHDQAHERSERSHEDLLLQDFIHVDRPIHITRPDSPEGRSSFDVLGSSQSTAATSALRHLQWAELWDEVPVEVSEQAFQAWRRLLQSIPIHDPPISTRPRNKHVSQHPRTAGIELRNLQTLPDWIPQQCPEIVIQAYKYSDGGVQWPDIAQRQGLREQSGQAARRAACNRIQMRCWRWRIDRGIEPRHARTGSIAQRAPAGSRRNKNVVDWEDIGHVAQTASASQVDRSAEPASAPVPVKQHDEPQIDEQSSFVEMGRGATATVESGESSLDSLDEQEAMDDSSSEYSSGSTNAEVAAEDQAEMLARLAPHVAAFEQATGRRASDFLDPRSTQVAQYEQLMNVWEILLTKRTEAAWALRMEADKIRREDA